MYLFHTPPPGFSSQVDVSGCFCVFQNRLLLLQRSDTKILANLWGIPQGKLEKGETPVAAMIREVQEETGIVVAEERAYFLGAVYMRVPKVDFTFHLFKTEFFSLPLLLLNQENKDFSWASKEEIGRLPLMPGADECIAFAFPAWNRKERFL